MSGTIELFLEVGPWMLNHVVTEARKETTTSTTT